MEQILAHWTSLPNLHPAFVHFPIALTPLAWVFDFAGFLSGRNRDWLHRVGALLWALAAVAAGAAYWAGRQAADSLLGVPPEVQLRVSQHADWALYTLWALVATAVLRLAVARWGSGRVVFLSFTMFLGLVAIGVLAYTVDRGGSLVYLYAVAVKPQMKPATTAPTEGTTSPAASRSAEPTDDPTSRLHKSEEGVVTWEPVSTDAAALGTVLRPAEGAAFEPVRAVPAGAEPVRGLLLEVSGHTLLVLDGTFGDVELSAVVVAEGFRGTIGLAHHVQTATEGGLLAVEIPAGRFTLSTLDRPPQDRGLDRGQVQLPQGQLDLAVTATGRHLRGTLGGKLVVHGHGPPLPDGVAGILLDGEGRMRVERLTVTPITH